MDEKELNKPVEIADDELDCVTGGGGICVSRAATRNGKYYVYDGPMTEEALSSAYLCPKCGHTIHWGADIWSFSTKCEGCGERWWNKGNVDLNMKGGLWKEVSHKEFLWVNNGGKLSGTPIN